MIKFGGTEISVYPSEFQVTILDIDNAESSVRTANGTLTRDRIAVKRQIEMGWGLLTNSEITAILSAISPVFFEVYYPDPMTGSHETKTFYTGNRPALHAITKGNDILWSGLKITLTEK